MKNEKLFGFRTEEAFGEGYTDILAVVKHELLELQNPEIPTTLEYIFDKEFSHNEIISYIENLKQKGFDTVLWVCINPEEVLKEYMLEFDGEYTLDKYCFNIDEEDIVVLAHDTDGTLLALKSSKDFYLDSEEVGTFFVKDKTFIKKDFDKDSFENVPALLDQIETIKQIVEKQKTNFPC